MRIKHIYFILTLIVLASVTSEGVAQNAIEGKSIKYPYYAAKERVDQIKNNYKKVKMGMTPQEVKSILGEPDETRPLYEPKIWKPKQMGYSEWFIIWRKCENGSVKEKDEIVVLLRYDLQWKVTTIDHWGFDESEDRREIS